MSVLYFRDVNGTYKPKMFFDEAGTVDIQRYDLVKYPMVKRLTENQLANYWRPTEVNMSQDKIDYNDFTEAEKHVFSSNLKRQIILDSVQGRAPALCFLPIVSDSWAEAFINAWNFYEGIHSASYTHIIENVYANASEIYDTMKEIREISECSDEISKYYDELLRCIKEYDYADYRTKKAFYLCMVAVNALEQIRFHVSFACTFSFANRGKMKGSGEIVTLIRQDEAFHCGFTQFVLRQSPKEDPDMAKIAIECQAEVEAILYAVYRQELEWIEYLFSKGPIVGLTKQELIVYLQYHVGKCMRRNGVEPNFTVPAKEPIPWMRKFLNETGDDDQPAPQEETILQYQTGQVDMNVNEDEIDLSF